MNTRVFLRGLFVVGLVAALCAYGLAAANQEPNQGAAAKPGQTAGKPGAAQPGATRPEMAPEGAPSTRAAPGMMLQTTSQLIGKDVKSTQGEALGKVHDIVLMPDLQQVSYVALSSGGVFGMGGTLHAIPWQALQVSPKGDITLATSREQLKQAPSFSNNNWPNEGSSEWLKAGAAGQAPSAATPGAGAAGAGAAGPGQAAAGPGAAGQGRMATGPGAGAGGQNQAAASEKPEGQAAPMAGAAGRSSMANESVQMRRVTHLTGMDVKNPEGQDLGSIEDFVLDTSNGRILYDVIAFGGTAGIGEKHAAVPANAVRIQPQTHVATLNATLKTLESATFKPGDLASLSNPAQMQRLRQAFPAQAGGAPLGYVPAQSPQAQQAANESAWGPSGQYAKNFNPSAVKTIKGTVQSIGMFMPEGAPAGASGGLRLRVKTSDGNIMTVHAGPISYAEQNNFFAMPGEEITITGSEVKIGMHSMFVASELRKGNQTLRLRDQSGKPLWTMGQAPGQAAARPGAGPSGAAAGQKSSPAQPGNRTRQE